MNKRILALVVVMVFGCQGFVMAVDTQVDSLIKKLVVDKGIFFQNPPTDIPPAKSE